jgi:uncharacterized protein with NRDE domain
VCVVFLAFHADADFPVMIGANREESRRRPSTSPVCGRVAGFRCLLAGADYGPDGAFPEVGTWLGFNETGLVVAVTNRRDGELLPQDQTRSRGVLAASLLGFDDAGQAIESARDELSRGGFGGCNYLVASRRNAFVIEAPGARRISVQKLEQGIHVVTNLGPADPRIHVIRDHLDPGRFVGLAEVACRDDRVVVNGAENGTVSSSLILVGKVFHFLHLTGDPRSNAYEEFRPFVS